MFTICSRLWRIASVINSDYASLFHVMSEFSLDSLNDDFESLENVILIHIKVLECKNAVNLFCRRIGFQSYKLDKSTGI